MHANMQGVCEFMERASHVVQWSRICLPMQEKQETWFWSLGQEDPLEKEMATHSNILAWEILCPMDREAWRQGLKE